MRKTKILLIEDEKITSDVLKAYLEKEDMEVAVTENGCSALAAFHEKKPDLVVLDLMLPGMSGEEICQAIRRQSKVPLIMLTAKMEEHQQVQGLSLGADDYVVKPFSPRVLLARVHSLLRRTTQSSLSDENIVEVDQRNLIIDIDKREVHRFGQPVSLKPTEFKLLLILARNPGRVFERSQLAVKLHDYDYDGFDRTIDVHIRKLRQRLEVDPDQPTLIKTVFGVGYKLDSN